MEESENRLTPHQGTSYANAVETINLKTTTYARLMQLTQHKETRK